MNDWVSIAQSVLDENGLTDWSVEIFNGRRTIGLCDYSNKTICISKHHINNDPYESVMDTVYHEVAHALNPGDGHGADWKKTAKSLGGSGDPHHNHGEGYPSKWMMMCVNGHSTNMYRWGKNTAYTCKKCGTLMYIKRTDGTQITLSSSFVNYFNQLADSQNLPRIDRHGAPRI